MFCMIIMTIFYSSVGHIFADNAIIATLHRCHADIDKKLNFQHIYSLLYQNDILPSTSGEHFQLQSRGTDDNLMWYLHECTPEEFKRFIDAVKSTADECDGAHEELAVLLEKTFEEYQRHNNSGWL